MNFRLLPFVLALTLVSNIGLSKDPKAKAYLDPENAGQEYALQGEYVGKVQSDEGEKPIAAQVIAKGNGKFKIVGYPGGLPGEGWNRGDEQHDMDAEMSNGKLSFEFNEADVTIADGKIEVVAGGQTVAELSKVDRESPTLGMKPPAGAIVLFDGKTAEAFDNGKLFNKKYLAATGCSSKRKFGDHKIHLEFRTPFVPAASGQARGNSGVYIQSRYEIQVLDSFGLEGKNNECGGFYSVAEPVVNMCFPPLTWQTYDIDFTAAKYDADGKKTANARVSVKHNGLLIHDNIELPKATPGRHGEGPQPDSLFLQDHGNPVLFRNIWVVEK